MSGIEEKWKIRSMPVTLGATSASTNATRGNKKGQPATSLSPIRTSAPLDLLRPCYIDRLARDEIQSVMHFLTNNELLLFARSQYRLSRAASQPFAWRYAKPHSIDFPSQGAKSFDLRRSLVMNSPAGFDVSFDLDDAYHVRESQIDRLLLIPNMTRMSLTEERLSETQWRRILSSPSIDDVTHLSLSFHELEWDLSPLLSRLTKLCHLEIFTGDGLTQTQAAGLHLLPHLTSLIFGDAPEESCAEAIAKCQHLTELDVHGLMNVENPFTLSHFLTAPTMRRLKKLTFRQCHSFDRSTEDEFVAIFKGMTRLIELTLDDCENTDSLVRSLSHAPSLRTLTIEMIDMDYEQALPNIVIVGNLMQSNPRLTVHCADDRPEGAGSCTLHARLR